MGSESEDLQTKKLTLDRKLQRLAELAHSLPRDQYERAHDELTDAIDQLIDKIERLSF